MYNSLNKTLRSSAIPSLLCDFYKTSHRMQYPENTQIIYSTFTPRSNKHAPYLTRVVSFGFQAFIIKYLIHYFNDNFFNRPESDVVSEYSQFIAKTLQMVDKGEHIAQLHQLGYLPIRIKAIPEGKTVAVKVPMMTIENTHPDFFWLTNYLETLINVCLWQPITSASIAFAYRSALIRFAEKTCDNYDHILFQSHDFSMRGMSSLESAEMSGAGHLTCFLGTDTIPAISFINSYYGSQHLIGTSIPASEHSVMSAHGVDELPTFRYLMKQFPDNMLSIVSDTTDFWHNISVNLPLLKDEIMARPTHARVVIRPDSGDFFAIICGNSTACDEHERKGLIECLWDIFGGTVNTKGYKVLDPHIGAIYGDGVTYDKMLSILEGLERKGFASSNIVFGVGAQTYQRNTRDTLGFAVKATSITINGVEKAIFKNPKTDDGLKKSQKGRVKVLSSEHYIDELTSQDDFSDDLLELVFENGKLVKRISFDQIRANINMQI
ncbi:nicotinate phosphoribosyltransferase [Actinobacillus pleuropneumoniae]|uniref:Nicotinamide phosphoribosyltransferase n=1 Tax=Actinobacillus pleuropneumoniae TaxID=715 RepID=A0A9Q4DH20_ACTPL|nr:nicotinate phosphoribosyltransferase [Actinobacillus pleuropneumoniae]MCL7720399.1 nicotinate phosphoribosyltransferase [Actinobacillus pleuropneumoniae]MCL7728054.1 nicotinate phosphoribosyltransferase [Actinobacillus pleuropneumoniae]MCL7729594.1 nicotinate phosphoribosyltransferase [Actinobacillus pleuropneumoniae]MCY6367575.1 nicotinate phosphoribosyltransferase [Actinobacillus pleuropneumoniae]MCY6384443.1 nicotinate phosphoribosyltransferase [Actinobacillus pleuropneumoniae]